MRHRYYSAFSIQHSAFALLTLLALLALALFIAPAATSAQSTSTVTGVIFLSDAGVLPSTAIVTIQLADVTEPGVVASVTTERIFSTGGAQSPFSFTLPYNPEQINPARRYRIQGNIRVAGQTLYSTAVPYSVITFGSPTSNLQITMAKVATGGLPQSSGGAQPLLLAGTLLLAGLGTMAIRRRLGLARGAV
ncbi:YbaY family lipoprotein [Oscillochloris sp. ZM17-4]|uniref:YbaY family lipoprotein n=1 Tax=Oscillochloris sp. ZM17-4 TaxID=2866714 RepID=UPI001C733B52|nr:YbaY family lipoprotein [Oscillochloris sp. ZM17-4]MBX0326568.1 YbaY family lipoprotein [Oscillochloris sp. ZM17-4]